MSRTVASLISVLLASCCCACGAAHPTSARGHASATPMRPSRQAPPARGPHALAVAALVRVADLPPHWRERAAFRSDLRCRSQPFRGSRARVSSGRFVHENASFQETVAIFRDAAESRRALARLDSRSSIRCLARTARERMSEQAEGPATQPQLARGEAIGASGEALRFTARAESQIGIVRGVIDAVHVRVGRGVGALLIVSGPAVLRDDVYEGVVAAFQRRLHAALG